MSAPPRVILLDSNAYFRLARAVHPLLAKPFGPPPPYALRVIDDLDKEYKRSLRLKSKFEWVRQKQYVEDRSKRCYQPKGKIKKHADNAFSFLASHVRENNMTLSREDIKAIAVGFVRNIPERRRSERFTVPVPNR